MAIEIKQLVIKSSITDDELQTDTELDLALNTIKQELLNECRRLISEAHKDKGVR